ncbi:ankyrin repeat domain-containing protein [Clostridium saccharobutylicum]|uniref:Ankyrin repeat protein n=1 Tax=Clostridium saccharobutylicum TaxID=169679 RepID=A0A1S8N5G0_CLOSA|nr:ankyrin repeat domain-containing protein [Clostridium saccharobutylicum]OOM11677.1 ankyrin repeat protein [Clostridium saccharobutylicum]
MLKKIFLCILVLVAMIGSYHTISKASNYVVSKVSGTGEYGVNYINIYKNTPAWELALAVREEKIETIEKIVKNKQELLNYQDPKYGVTLLLWSVGMEKYNSAETLLKCGADPNIATTTDGETPLFLAAGYSWVDKDYKKDARYVKLLLSYGADPNKNYIGHDHDIIETGTSPLMNSIGCGIEKTKDLVEGGADINYKTKSGNTAAIVSLIIGGSYGNGEAMQYAYYLIAEKKVKINESYYGPENVIMPDDNPNDKFYPVNILRNWIPKLDSDEYIMKMKIVDEFARQGVNYWNTKIPSNRLSQIKKIYPDTWEEYIKKY